MTTVAIMRVYCDDSAHLRKGEKRPRRAEVTKFVKMEGGGWQEFAGHTAREAREIKGRPKRDSTGGLRGRLSRMVAPSVNTTRQIAPSEESYVFGSNELTVPRPRFRFRFSCRLCPRTVPAREDKLHALFDELEAEGRVEVPLTELASRL